MSLAAMLSLAGDWTSCCSCGIAFGAPASYLDQRRADKQDFFCPNGHALSFTTGTVEKLRAELAERDRQLALERQRVEEAKRSADSAARSRDAIKGQVTRLKRRVQNGVCPCCKRTISQMARHMASKHPGWQSQEIG